MKLTHKTPTRNKPAAQIGTAVPVIAALATTAVALLRQRSAATKFERLGAAALETLLNAIDANDPVTGAHVRRVARFGLVIADAMGLDEHSCHAVERVALFHDIGKIHEALYDVIHDAGGLDPTELREIHTHPQRGALVLAPLASFYPDLPKGVVAHHERWDGSGYPRRLKGKSIPLSARIVAIADTFDAITHSRRYRAGRSFEVAVQAIGEGRGTQFDPELVDLFVLPPVLNRIRAEMRAAGNIETAPARQRRSHSGSDVSVPDISFRWRATSPKQTIQDLTQS
ncbi:MAG: HD domain-containing phosphohydrolase [Gemmatimonadaceae bacterium]